MSEFEQQLIADVTGEMQRLADERNFLGQFLAVIDPSAGKPAKRKYKPRKNKKRGRPTNAEIAAREVALGTQEKLSIT